MMQVGLGVPEEIEKVTLSLGDTIICAINVFVPKTCGATP